MMGRVSERRYAHAIKHPTKGWAQALIKRYEGFSGADKEFTKRRAQNVKERTDAEVVFENMLRRLGVPYVREFPVFVDAHYYFLDFLIKHPFRIAFEIDGEVHRKQGSYDLRRDGEVMQQERIVIVRLPNEEVMQRTSDTETTVKKILHNRLLSVYRDAERVTRTYPSLA